MNKSPLLNELRQRAGRFATDQRGNIAVIFAIALVPIIGFIGAAVDYTRANNARSSMQAALDSTALWVSKDNATGGLTATQVTAKAQAYFNALYKGKGAENVAITATYSTNSTLGQNIKLTGSGSITTQFMKIAGFPNMNFNTSSTAAWGITKMRVAMALDVTGSMKDDDKMASMQSAATDLVTSLSDSAKTADDVYISIIPFAQMVNVDVANKSKYWIDWSDWDQTHGSCSWFWLNSKSSCLASNKTWTSDRSAWKGCVTDRDQPYDTRKDGPVAGTSTLFTAVEYVENSKSICPEAILPMTSAFGNTNITAIKKKISDLKPAGGTNQPIGMHWAWLSLQTGDPLNTPPKDPNYSYTDAIIILSDGLNTIDRWYGDGKTPSSQVDDRQRLLCTNIKTPETGKKAPVVFTIQVNTQGDPESAVLKSCADNGNFYLANNTAAVTAAFKSIGASLSKLRIAR